MIVSHICLSLRTFCATQWGWKISKDISSVGREEATRTEEKKGERKLCNKTKQNKFIKMFYFELFIMMSYVLGVAKLHIRYVELNKFKHTTFSISLARNWIVNVQSEGRFWIYSVTKKSAGVEVGYENVLSDRKKIIYDFLEIEGCWRCLIITN